MDDWGIDVLIGGSQKSVMIPPGLSYLAVCERAWDRMEATYNPRYYFDLRKERKNAKQGRVGVHPGGRADRRPGRRAGLDRRTGCDADNPAGNLVEGRRSWSRTPRPSPP